MSDLRVDARQSDSNPTGEDDRSAVRQAVGPHGQCLRHRGDPDALRVLGPCTDHGQQFPPFRGLQAGVAQRGGRPKRHRIFGSREPALPETLLGRTGERAPQGRVRRTALASGEPCKGLTPPVRQSGPGRQQAVAPATLNPRAADPGPARSNTSGRLARAGCSGFPGQFPRRDETRRVTQFGAQRQAGRPVPLCLPGLVRSVGRIARSLARAPKDGEFFVAMSSPSSWRMEKLSASRHVSPGTVQLVTVARPPLLLSF